MTEESEANLQKQGAELIIFLEIECIPVLYSSPTILFTAFYFGMQ